MNNITIKHLENDGRDWYLINGVDDYNKIEFDNETYGITKDGSLLDSDGCPIDDSFNKDFILGLIGGR